MQCSNRSLSPSASADGTPSGIALFLKGFGPGGVERIALRLATGWRATGMDVRLTLASADGPMCAAPIDATCTIAPDWPLVGKGWRIVRLTAAMLGQMRDHPPAILFCPGNAYTIVAILLKIALGRACPPIIAKVSNDLERRDMSAPMQSVYRLWLWVQGRMIDHFAVLSAPMAQEVMHLMRVTPGRVHIVPNPVLSLADLQSDAPEAKPRPSGGRRFVAVGRLERQKDYPLMLRAFAAGSTPADRLIIVGEGRERAALETLANELGIAARVHFPGHCTTVRATLRDQDILLLSSTYEGQPGAVVEALSVGLCVIATRCCAGMDELLDDGALGLLVDRDDVQGLAKAIAAAQPGTQDHTRARAKAQDFTIEAAVPAYAALFATVLAERQASAPRRTRLSPPRTRAKTV
jgi:glycosyltransferase involved in cell wall biosynthesis